MVALTRDCVKNDFVTLVGLWHRTVGSTCSYPLRLTAPEFAYNILQQSLLMAFSLQETQAGQKGQRVNLLGAAPRQ